MKKIRKTKANRGNRTADIELDTRVAKVGDLIIAGANTAQIVAFCVDKYKVNSRTTDRYIQKARKKLAELAIPERKEELNTALLRYRSLYSKCMTIQDYKTAASIQDRICKLLGLWDESLTVKHEGGMRIEFVDLWKA
jgi:hypothetical protein